MSICPTDFVQQPGFEETGHSLSLFRKTFRKFVCEKTGHWIFVTFKDKKFHRMFSLNSQAVGPGSRNFLKSFLRPPVIESTGLELKPLNPVIAMLTETSQKIFILESQKYKDYFLIFFF